MPRNVTIKKYHKGFNALRLVIGTMDETDKDTPDEIVLLETIDDMNGEALGYTLEQLFENGAL